MLVDLQNRLIEQQAKLIELLELEVERLKIELESARTPMYQLPDDMWKTYGPTFIGTPPTFTTSFEMNNEEEKQT